MISKNRFRYKYILASPFIFLSSCTFFNSEIREINSLVEAQKEFSNIDEKTLIIFDIDDTITSPIEKTFYLFYRNINDFDSSDTNFIKQLHDDLMKNYVKPGNSIYSSKLTPAVFAKTKFTPVEPITIETIKKLQLHGAKIIALTAANAGKFGEIENMQKWRLDNLNQVGLDFSNSFSTQEITFDKLNPDFGFYPVFYKGIICSANNLKGKTLLEFFEKINWKPNKIIFLDDSLAQCQRVRDEMKKLNIPTQCFNYRAAYINKIKLDQNVVKYQYDHWIKYQEFLTEKEALEQMSHKPIDQTKDITKQINY